MATNFPSSADSFTNPSPSDDMATVSHSSQHTNVNDAVEAIETALLDGAPLHIDDANERVGIGTASPANTLHVDSGSTDQFAAPQIYVAPSGHASSDRAAIQLDDIQLLTDIAGDGTEDFSIYSNNAAAHRLSIDGSGNVGIGTTSPAHPLDVNGKVIVGGGDNQTPDASGNGHLMIDGAGYTGFNSLDGTAMWVGHNSGSRSLYLATDETARVTVTGAGNVGIGTTSPVMPIDFNAPGSNGARMRFEDGTSQTSGIQFTANGAAVDYSTQPFMGKEGTANSDDVGFWHSGAWRWLLDSSGRVKMPYQPSFYAYQAGTGQSTGGTQPSQISFNNVQHNVGSHFSTSTDRFTAPIAGRYLVQWYGLGSATNSVSRYYLYINGAAWNNLHIRGDGPYPGYTRVVILNLNANDYLSVHYTNDSSAAQYTGGGDSYYTFAATLLG